MKSLTTASFLLSTITFAGAGCFSDPTATAPTAAANAGGQGNGGQGNGGQGNGGQTTGGSGGQGAGGSAAGGHAGTPGSSGSGADGGQAGSGVAGGGQAGSGAAGGGQAGAAGGGQAGAGNATGAAGGGDKDKYKTDPNAAALPPGPPASSPPNGTGALIQAATRFFLGDTDRSGNTSNDAWMDYGFDIDGLSSTVGNTYHCLPFTDAKKMDVFVSGPGGLDNSFGKNILILFSSVTTNPSADMTQAINDGKSSIVIRMNSLGTAQSYTGLNASFFAVSGMPDGNGGFVPQTASEIASGTYSWHARPELLNPDSTSKTVFPAAYLANGTFVSGTARGDISFFLTLGDLELVIHQAQLSMVLSADHKTSTNGTIGGVLNTEEFVQAFKQYAGSVSSSLCSGATFESLAKPIRQASDIMADGTQDPTKVCNGISIGLGFEMGPALLGDAAPPNTSPDPCP